MLARMPGKTGRAHHLKSAAHFGDVMRSEFALFISLETAAIFWQQGGTLWPSSFTLLSRARQTRDRRSLEIA
jgi:hypothetical protein